MGSNISNISFYAKNQLGTPSKVATIKDIYNLIAEDHQLKKDTFAIVEKHREGILSNLKGISKTSYQEDKKNALNGVCWSGNVDRSQKEPSFYHTGLINIDIDENTTEDLRLFRDMIRADKFPFISACGLSISGHINSHCWINANIEVPEEIQFKYKELETLHKSYAKAISKALSNIVIAANDSKQEFNHNEDFVIYLPIETLRLKGIKSGHRLNIVCGASDIKRLRYVTHDDRLIIRNNAKAITLEELKNFEARQDKKRDIKRMEDKMLNVIAKDHFDYCHQYAQKSGYEYTPGQRNSYLLYFSVCANLLGIPYEETLNYLLATYEDIGNKDSIKYPYKTNTESFGQWKHKANIKQKNFLPMEVKTETFLTFNKYLSDSKDFDKLQTKIIETKNTLLIVPTGSGKTHSALSDIYQNIKRIHKDKVFIFINPLKAITEQNGTKEGLPSLQVLCEGHTSYMVASFVDTISTYNSFMKWCEVLHQEDRLKDVILVIDEIQEMILASGYQNISALPYIANQCFKTIGLTATPLTPLISEYNFTPIKCERLQNPEVNINYLRTTKNKLNKVLLSFGNDHKEDKVLYFYNSKEGIEKLQKAYTKKGLKAEYFHADIKRNDKHVYNHLIKEGTLPSDVDHLFSTKILGFGTSFKSLDHIVYVTRNTSKDLLEFMQSYARLREDNINVTVILVEPINAKEKKQRQYDFDLNQIHKIEKELQATADSFNLANDKLILEGVQPLKDNLPTIYKYIRRNAFTNVYFVDKLALLNDQYQRIINSISTEDFLHFIGSIPNVTLTDINEQKAILTAEDQKIIEDIEQEHQEDKKQDIELLKDLFHENADIILKYIKEETEDDKLKKAINKLRVLTYIEVNKDQEALINKRFTMVQNAVKRYLKLFEDFPTINKTQLIDICFFDSYKYGQTIKQLNTLYNVQRSNDSDLQETIRTDAKGRHKLNILKAHLELISFFSKCKEKESIDDLHNKIKSVDFYNVLCLNAKTWTKEVEMLFNIKKIRTNKERLIKIGERIHLEDVLHVKIQTQQSA